MLADGTILRLGGKEAERFADLIRPGCRIEARGKGTETALGRVLETEGLAVAADQRERA